MSFLPADFESPLSSGAGELCSPPTILESTTVLEKDYRSTKDTLDDLEALIDVGGHGSKRAVSSR